jgi:hypothetical protein
MSQIRFRIGTKFYLSSTYPRPGTWLVVIRSAIEREILARYMFEDEAFISRYYQKRFPGPWTADEAGKRAIQLFIMNHELEQKRPKLEP